MRFKRENIELYIDGVRQTSLHFKGITYYVENGIRTIECKFDELEPVFDDSKYQGWEQEQFQDYGYENEDVARDEEELFI